MAKIDFRPGVTKEKTPLTVGAGYIDSNLIRFRSGKPCPIGGWTQYFPTSLTGVCRAIKEFADLAGNTIKAFATNDEVYLIVAGTLYTITPSGFSPGAPDAYYATGFGIGGFGTLGFGLSGPPSTDPLFQILNQPLLWSLDNFGEDLILCPYSDVRNPGPIYIWYGNSGPGQPAKLLSDDPAATAVPILCRGCFVNAQSEQLMAVGANPYDGTVPDPMLIRWSDVASETDWLPTQANSAGDYRLSIGSEIIGWLNMYYETLFWTDQAIYTAQYTGTNNVYSFNPISVKGISIISPRAAISNGSQAFWMDSNAFFTYNGSVVEIDCPLKQFVFADINRKQAFKIHSAHNHSFSEVKWFYPSIAGNGECDSYVKFNYKDGVWDNGKMSRTAWSDSTTPSGQAAAPLATDPAGVIWQHESGVDAGTQPMPWSLTSGDIDIEDGAQYVLLNRLINDFEWLGPAKNLQQIALDIRTKQSSNQTPRVAKTVQLVPGDNNKGYVNARVRGRRVSFRIYNPGVLGTFWIGGTLQADFQADGEV